MASAELSGAEKHIKLIDPHQNDRNFDKTRDAYLFRIWVLGIDVNTLL
jgi:hypothetical protein